MNRSPRGFKVHRHALVLLALVAIGCAKTHPMIGSVEAFRASREAGDYDAARTHLSENPRVWYGSREGEGSPWTLGAGRWKEWDDHFNGKSDRGPWTVEGNTVWAVATETNDYFRLIERQDVSQYRITYFFDDSGKIEGYMISAADPGRPREPSVDRFQEFEAWALENDPEEWEYLRPGGKLDPTGDRPARTRVLLNRWRREVGLPVIE